MKKEEKKNSNLPITLLIVIIVVLIIIIGIAMAKRNKNTEEPTPQATVEEFVDVLEDGTKLNVSDKLNEEKTFEGLIIKNIQLSNSEDITELIADIENPTDNDTEAKLVDVVFYDKAGNEISQIAGRISPIKAKSTMQFSTSAMIDYSNVYNFEFKAK